MLRTDRASSLPVSPTSRITTPHEPGKLSKPGTLTQRHAWKRAMQRHSGTGTFPPCPFPRRPLARLPRSHAIRETDCSLIVPRLLSSNGLTTPFALAPIYRTQSVRECCSPEGSKRSRRHIFEPEQVSRCGDPGGHGDCCNIAGSGQPSLLPGEWDNTTVTAQQKLDAF
ncbi:hypothetical protein VTK56DRAFT_7550 [Thermocarpiscus australiensis]